MSSADARLERALAEGPPTGGWFLHGDAARLRDDAARRLAEAAVDPATRDFNFDQFRGDDVGAEELASALAMPPMMSDRRVVIVRDAERLAGNARKALEEVLDAIPADIVLVVTATIPKGSRAKLYTKLRKRCRVLEWSAPKSAEIPGWIRERARSAWGLNVPADAAQALAGAVGDDLSRLDAELEKLAAIGERTVTRERVEELVPRTRRIDRWRWLDLVAERRYDRALATLEDLLAAERGVGLVAGLVEHHLLLGVAVAGGAGLVRETLKRTGRGYLSWKANMYASQAEGWTEPGVDRALRLFHRADRWLKSGGSDHGVMMDLLLSLEREKAAA